MPMYAGECAEELGGGCGSVALGVRRLAPAGPAPTPTAGGDERELSPNGRGFQSYSNRLNGIMQQFILEVLFHRVIHGPAMVVKLIQSNLGNTEMAGE